MLNEQGLRPDAEWMRKPEYRSAYDALAPDRAGRAPSRRAKAGLTQEQMLGLHTHGISPHFSSIHAPLLVFLLVDFASGEALSRGLSPREDHPPVLSAELLVHPGDSLTW